LQSVLKTSHDERVVKFNTAEDAGFVAPLLARSIVHRSSS
jgi:hypothetical protein